ncbi:MAG: hypothetical protein RQ731_05570 [Anaerosomatales bacterium]|nr:hypothetical protein [Anaerosomatales bacterium]
MSGGIEGSAAQIPVWGIWTLVGLTAAVALYAGGRSGSVTGSG